MVHLANGDRGQTALDFAIAIGVFIVAIGFVLAFVPSMFAPFFGMGSADGLTADRSATYLAENALVDDPKSPASLNETAVEEFFEECGGAEWLAEELSVGTTNIHVQLLDAEAILDIETDTCGGTPSGAETVSNRVVSIGDSQTILRVVVW